MNLRQFMLEAYDLATASHDPSTQNGALIIRNNEVVAFGYNHVPTMKGEELKRVLNNRDLKYPRVVHAETAAIACAARQGIKTQDLTMVCPWASCLTCAGIMITAGIKRLVVHGPRMRFGHAAKWTPAIHEALAWFEKSGLKVEFLDESLPKAPRILVNGELWQP